MTADYDETVMAHYAGQAAEHGDRPSSTMEDARIREVETAAILMVGRDLLRTVPLGDGIHVVDVGCGNGATLAKLTEGLPDFPNPAVTFTGIEYSAELRAIAEDRFATRRDTRILAGDIRRLGAVDCPPADLVILQRVLINLLDAGDQHRALNNVVELLAPGGVLIAIEAFVSGLERLNEARAEFDLTPLPPAAHNLYLPDGFFEHPALAPRRDPAAPPRNLLSTHYYVSRVVHAALQRGLGQAFKRNSHFVRFLSQALRADIGDYAPLQLFVLQKAERPNPK